MPVFRPACVLRCRTTALRRLPEMALTPLDPPPPLQSWISSKTLSYQLQLAPKLDVRWRKRLMAVATAATDFRMLAAVEMAEKVDEDLRSLKQRTCVVAAAPFPPGPPLSSPQARLVRVPRRGGVGCMLGGTGGASLPHPTERMQPESAPVTSPGPSSSGTSLSWAAPMLCPTPARAAPERRLTAPPLRRHTSPPPTRRSPACLADPPCNRR